MHEWEPKSETQRLAEFVEYLDLYQQAGGQINLEEELGQDAVQLMTVHAAKGLEFDHVFLLRSDAGKFSQGRSAPAVLEFPDELMKEERPRGDFHVQEERRLFYVALTRARDRLTITAVVDNKRNKPSPFLDDILENGAWCGAISSGSLQRIAGGRERARRLRAAVIPRKRICSRAERCAASVSRTIASMGGRLIVRQFRNR